MKELLIFIVYIMTSTCLQKESVEDLSPARIFLANSRVKEGQEVKFKCKVDDVQTRRVYVLLCKNGVTVKTVELEESKEDSEFVIDRVAVKDSGSYTCVYSDGNHTVCEINFQGHNSVSLDVFESAENLRPARIFLAHSRLKEGQEVKFKCKIADVRTGRVYVLLCKNGVTVKTVELEESKEDSEFVIDRVAVKDSGSYTCVYSDGNHTVCEINFKGCNSVSLEVFGEILPASIKGTQSSIREGEDLMLTCSITVNQSCSEVYVYLCLNGIGKSTRTVNCNININHITATFLLVNVKREQSGNYSCVYSTSDRNLNEIRETGENTISIEVYGGGQSSVTIPLLVAAALVLAMFLFYQYRKSITLRLCLNSDSSANPDSAEYYSTITPGADHVDENQQLGPAGGPVYSVSAMYATVQKCKGKEVKNAESSEASLVYSLAMPCEERTEQPGDYYAELH